jgi:hypothetical protein
MEDEKMDANKLIRWLNRQIVDCQINLAMAKKYDSAILEVDWQSRIKAYESVLFMLELQEIGNEAK